MNGVERKKGIYCLCVCWSRERGREGKRERERKEKGEGEGVCDGGLVCIQGDWYEVVWGGLVVVWS